MTALIIKDGGEFDLICTHDDPSVNGFRRRVSLRLEDRKVLMKVAGRDYSPLDRYIDMRGNQSAIINSLPVDIAELFDRETA